MAYHVKEDPWGFAVRVHADWMEKCRTCRHWYRGSEGRENLPATAEFFCKNPESSLHRVRTDIDSHCPFWDSYWEDAALHVLQNVEDGKAADAT